MVKKILVINGPNLNLLGTRETKIYGRTTLAQINQMIKKEAARLKVKVEFFQSNHEGEIVDRIGRAGNKYAAIIINPAAYTHTSVAIRDAIAAVKLPVVEVHLSNIYSREDFRHTSLTAPVCLAQISGFGPKSYLLALEGLVSILCRE